MLVSNATDQGERPYQEDYHAYYAPPKGMEERGTLMLLADGMGGMAGGATASFLAVENFKNAYYAPDRDDAPAQGINDRLARILPEVNATLLAASRADVNLTGMGTTLIAAVVERDRLHWVSIGDSHLYLLHDGVLRLLSEDHSVGAEVERRRQAGTITEEYAKTFEGQHHKLMHYLGDKNFAHFDVSAKPEELHPDDRVVMCSDGLYGTLPEAELTRVLLASDPSLSANALVRAALDLHAPGQDNVTVQVVSFGGETPAKGEEPQEGRAAPSQERPQSSRRALWIFVVLLCAALGGSWYWFRHSGARPQASRTDPAASTAQPQPQLPAESTAAPSKPAGAAAMANSSSPAKPAELTAPAPAAQAAPAPRAAAPAPPPAAK